MNSKTQKSLLVVQAHTFQEYLLLNQNQKKNTYFLPVDK